MIIIKTKLLITSLYFRNLIEERSLRRVLGILKPIYRLGECKQMGLGEFYYRLLNMGKCQKFLKVGLIKLRVPKRFISKTKISAVSSFVH